MVVQRRQSASVTNNNKSYKTARDFKRSHRVGGGSLHQLGTKQKHPRLGGASRNLRATFSTSPTPTGEPTPPTLRGLGPSLVVTAGGLHSCAVEVSGRAKCWGKGEDGLSSGAGFGRVEAGRTALLGVKSRKGSTPRGLWKVFWW